MLSLVAKYLCLVIIFCSFHVSAQNHIRVTTTANGYFGDLNTSPEKWNGGFGIGIQFQTDKRYNGQLILNAGKIVGQNPSSTFNVPNTTDIIPNRFFETNYLSFNYEGHMSLIQKERFRLYAGIGLGLLRFVPRDAEGNELFNQSDTRLDEETYGSIAFILPLKLGVKYYLKNKYGLELEVAQLNPSTDYLDNIAELGAKSGNDNIRMIRFSVLVPILQKTKKPSN